MIIFPKNFYPQVESPATGATMGMIGKFFDFCFSFAVNQVHKNGFLGVLSGNGAKIHIMNKRMNSRHKEQDAILQE